MASPSPSPRRLTRIIRVSRAMAWITLLCALALGAALLGFPLFDPDGLDLLIADAFALPADTVLPPAIRAGLIAIGALPVLVAIAGLLATRALFLGFARGEVFTPRSGRWLKRIGLIVLLSAPLGVAVGAAASALASLPAPEGARQVVVAISSDQIAMTIAGVLVLVLGWTLEEAARLADENRQFV
ncbi:DUF2975 domain-containing protein [Stappia sp.]|uniref:DUF2975 domain-containing protein n=1 Tax=Stappia sp. TaxID=1870903 RepID=UPI0032D9ABF4